MDRLGKESLMSDLLRAFKLAAWVLLLAGGCRLSDGTLATRSDGPPGREETLGMIKASRGVLAPVYGPLAEQIVVDLDLKDKTGVGIDVGGGPGALIVELCKRTRLHWINADINPHVFTYFCREAEKHGVGHRVSAVMADVHSLPFRDNYADVVVSRGSFQSWTDRVQAFAEIYRVLKPGGAAYIGRGFSENLPAETARRIRARQRGKMTYDVEKTAAQLREVMDKLAIADYRIYRPRADLGDTVNYGIWLTFRKHQSR